MSRTTMSVFGFAFNGITPLILLVVLGYTVKRVGLLDQTTIDKVTKFLFQVAFPISLFNSIYKIEISDYFNPLLFAYAIGMILLIVCVLMLVLPRFVPGNKQRGAMIQGIYRGNYLLLGYPLALNLFGDTGVGPTAMLLPVVIFTYNVLAVFVLEFYRGEESRIKPAKVILGVAKNPLIIGAVIGVIFSLLPLELPLFISRTVDDVGKIANPMALIMLGGQFSWQRISGKVNLIVWATALREFAIPLLTTSGAILLGFRGPELGALFILFASPTAVTSFIMAKTMDSDGDLASQIVLATTLTSGLSLFIGIYILRALALI
ncbi:MAG: AEC family transporter [Eubacteriales bacterium]|nr:AEC family transporter [Eubacteriales bacterium]